MARIPVANFGQAVPQAHQTQLPQNQSGQIIGSVLQSAGEQAGQYLEAKDKLQRESEVAAKRLELYNNELDKKEGQLKVDAVLTTEFSDKTTELRNQVGNGTLSAAAANTALKTWSDEKFTELRTQLPGHAMPDYQNYWDANVNKQSGSFLPLQLKATEQKDRVLNSVALANATRMSRDEGRASLNEYLKTSAVSEAEKQQIRLDFEIAHDRKELESGIESAFSSGDIAALQQVQASITDKKFLDSKAAQSYSSSISSKIMTLNNRAEIAENKRVNEAGKVFNEFKRQVLTGVALGAELIQNTGIAVKGTEHEAEYNFYVKQSKDFQTFANLSTSEQLKKINQYKAYQKKHTSNDPESDNKILATYESIYADKLKTAKENPTQALRQAGINVPDLNPTMISANPAAAAKTIAEIGAYQVAQQDKDPNATISPISPDVLGKAQESLKKMSVNQKLDFISNMITATNNTKGGQQIWQTTLQQLGGGDRTYLLAGLARSKNKKLGGEDLATTLINGDYLIKSGKYVLPNELEVKFREKYGNLIAYGSFDDDFNSFKQAYAAIGNRAGEIPIDSKSLAKTNVINQAFDLVTGGVYKQPYGSWFGGFKTTGGGSFNAWQVPKPYGMNDDRFKANLEAGYLSISKTYGYDIYSLKNFRLRPRIDRNNNFVMYSLINEAGTELKNPKTGKEIFIEFKGVHR